MKCAITVFFYFGQLDEENKSHAFAETFFFFQQYIQLLTSIILGFWEVSCRASGYNCNVFDTVHPWLSKYSYLVIFIQKWYAVCFLVECEGCKWAYVGLSASFCLTSMTNILHVLEGWTALLQYNWFFYKRYRFCSTCMTWNFFNKYLIC